MTLLANSRTNASSFDQLVRQRRATQHFAPDEVPDESIVKALRMASEAPSGYNIQPWRFIVVQDAGTRALLREAASDQEKITEAPVVIVACAERDAWKERMNEVLLLMAQRTGGDPASVEQRKRGALKFIEGLPREVWLNRHVMIAFTYLMLAFESLGWDTAPMEGFDAGKVRPIVGLPNDAAVVALLAVGRATGPERRHPGRLSIEETVFGDRYGQPFGPASSTT